MKTTEAQQYLYENTDIDIYIEYQCGLNSTLFRISDKEFNELTQGVTELAAYIDDDGDLILQ